MTREIKFRAWDTFDERMVYDPYLFQPSGDHDRVEGDFRFDAPFTYYEDWQDVDDGIKRPCYIMQYTGLKDKNGKEIYEGDFVIKTVKDYGRPETNPFLVNWVSHQCGFNVSDGKSHWYEVVGNIYEHPDLLQQKTQQQ